MRLSEAEGVMKPAVPSFCVNACEAIAAGTSGRELERVCLCEVNGMLTRKLRQRCPKEEDAVCCT